MARVALVVLCSFLASSVHAETLLDASIRHASEITTAGCEESTAKGQAAAAEHGTKGWFWGGVGAGVGVGLIGTGAITAGAAFSNPKATDIPGDVEPVCYKAGYRGEAKGKNVKAALIGGLVGTAAFLGVSYAACVNTYRYSSDCSVSLFPH
jgi:hypothetical protein